MSTMSSERGTNLPQLPPDQDNLTKTTRRKSKLTPKRRHTIAMQALAEKRKPEIHWKMRGYQTFKQMREGFIEDVYELYDQFEEKIPFRMVENVVAYSKCLCKEQFSDIIDENLFNAVMAYRFSLTKPSMLAQMYRVASKKIKQPILMTVNNLSELILTFMTPDVTVKADFSFSVYDLTNKGHLNKTDLKTVLAPMLVDIKHDDLDEDEDMAQYLVDLVTASMDTNTDQVIDRGEFKALVKKDKMWLQFLGPCLASTRATESFRKLLEDKTMFDIQSYFRQEIKTVLQRPAQRGYGTFNGLYPFPLELP